MIIFVRKHLRMMKTALYPLTFRPSLHEKVWGGHRIEPFKGLPSTGRPVGESWEISAVPGKESVVAEGPLAGRTLTSLVEEYGAELLGHGFQERSGWEFPLLLKFIDAAGDLSVQVHPDDALAARSGARGKTEMWYVVDAAPDASLLVGFSRRVTPEECLRRAQDGSIVEVLARHAIRPGDVFFLPAGRIHAICRGAFVAEIQQSSDITYRVFDYGRAGLDGKPRPLHVAEALEALDFQVYDDYRTRYEPTPGGEVTLVRSSYFTTTLLVPDGPFRKDLSAQDAFVTMLCVKGEGALCARMADGAEHTLPLRPGAALLLPACTEGVTLQPAPQSPLTLLSSFVE